ncbi:MAG: hypothetical protein JWN34_5790 [Bryobacterales bacterium]|nr:hypothetical protein [Bryobacterales bacterium]
MENGDCGKWPASNIRNAGSLSKVTALRSLNGAPCEEQGAIRQIVRRNKRPKPNRMLLTKRPWLRTNRLRGKTSHENHPVCLDRDGVVCRNGATFCTNSFV